MKALKLALTVPRRVDQKLIKKKDVKPISSQPKNKEIKEFELTRNNILKIKLFNKIKKLEVLPSNFK